MSADGLCLLQGNSHTFTRDSIDVTEGVTHQQDAMAMGGAGYMRKRADAPRGRFGGRVL